MNQYNDRYVIFPRILNLDKYPIKYQDALTYCAIRSFQNSRTKKCYPTIASVSKVAGVSKDFTSKSIKRLEIAGLIKIVKRGKYRVYHQYDFSKVVAFERIPYELFKASNLTYSEKALLICIRQFFNLGSLKSLDTVSKMAEWLGLSYSTVKKQFSSLINKGYISEITFIIGQKAYSRYHYTDKINWVYHYKEKVAVKPKSNWIIKVS